MLGFGLSRPLFAWFEIRSDLLWNPAALAQSAYSPARCEWHHARIGISLGIYPRNIAAWRRQEFAFVSYWERFKLIATAFLISCAMAVATVTLWWLVVR
jgi:hypothetical protein